jgi:hypothetical protein
MPLGFVLQNHFISAKDRSCWHPATLTGAGTGNIQVL